MIIPLPQSSVHLTYCSNLHPIEKSSQVLQIARNIWPQVADKLRAQFPSPQSGIDLGVWLSEQASASFGKDHEEFEQLQRALGAFGGQVLTANAFPMGNFHGDHVKEKVYLPDWQDPRRLNYSIAVAELLAQLPHQSSYQSMSTSPGSFKSFPHVDKNRISHNLKAFGRFLARLRQETGRTVVLAIEPEPGCTLETTDEFIRFYENQILSGGRDEEVMRRHIGICFDCCHQAIQYEDPVRSLSKLRRAGISVGKVQLSSAIEITEPQSNDEAIKTLATFAEDRYLHQVVARDFHGNIEYFDDLPDYLGAMADREDESARVHFHVPVFLENIGPLKTTQNDLGVALREVVRHQDCDHLEIETYTWAVLPERRHVDASDEVVVNDILREYRWVHQQLLPAN